MSGTNERHSTPGIAGEAHIPPNSADACCCELPAEYDHEHGFEIAEVLRVFFVALAAAAVEAVGLRVLVDQALELARLARQIGADERRRQVADRHRGDAALGLRGLARIADDEGIEDGQRPEHGLGKARLRQRDRLAGQPFERAVRTHVHERVDVGAVLQPHHAEEIDDAEYHVVPPRATEAPPAEKPAPVAPAPKPAPPAATAPTNGNGKHNVMPKDGSELFARLKAKEKELVDAQHCEEGALLKYVRSAVVPKGHDQDMRNWNADAIRLAVDALKKFLHDLSPIGLEGAQKLEDLIYKGGGTWDKVLPEINLPKDFTYANLNHFEERLILALLAKKQPEPEEVPI